MYYFFLEKNDHVLLQRIVISYKPQNKKHSTSGSQFINLDAFSY
jgi:hypothetical protein